MCDCCTSSKATVYLYIRVQSNVSPAAHRLPAKAPTSFVR